MRSDQKLNTKNFKNSKSHPKSVSHRNIKAPNDQGVRKRAISLLALTPQT